MELDYLITGGAGFIGCALANELVRSCQGCGPPSILAVDNLHPQVHSTPVRPKALPAAAQLAIMDVCDEAGWDRLLADVDPKVLVHLAAETGTGQSLNLPGRHTNVNVNGTAKMLEALDRAGRRPSHIVLTSSRAVYGEGAWLDPRDGSTFTPGQRTVDQLERGQFAVMAPSGEPAVPLPQNEAVTRAGPASIYGVTKLAQEQILTLWCAARGVPLSILRLQNVYGAGQSPHNPYTGIVGLFHRVAAAGSVIEAYEDGLIGRDFIYIDDVAKGMAATIEMPPAERRILDVGSGFATTILDAARTIANLYGAPDPRISGAYRLGDIRWAVAAVDAIKDELGFCPQIGFEQGNRLLSAWLRQLG